MEGGLRMKSTDKASLALPTGYADWLAQLKSQIAQARHRASLSVSAELVQLCGRIGRDILERQQSEGWGTKPIDRLVYLVSRLLPNCRAI
jgi:hypothetical protein